MSLNINFVVEQKIRRKKYGWGCCGWIIYKIIIIIIYYYVLFMLLIFISV